MVRGTTAYCFDCDAPLGCVHHYCVICEKTFCYNCICLDLAYACICLRCYNKHFEPQGL